MAVKEEVERNSLDNLCDAVYELGRMKDRFGFDLQERTVISLENQVQTLMQIINTWRHDNQ